MKIAISAAAPNLDADVDPRFGRCPCFLIVNDEDMTFKTLDNSSQTLSQGAGIQAAKLVADSGAQFVLTGNCGPNAHQTLSAAGIGVIVGCAGPIRNAVEQFKSGQLKPADQPNAAAHSGISGMAPKPAQMQQPQTPPQQPGMGMGRGRGGMGRGMGRGMGQGGGMGGGMGQGGGRRRGGC